MNIRLTMGGARKTASCLLAVLWFGVATAIGQPPPVPDPPAPQPGDEEVEPLLRGPIHEAFAEPVQLDLAEAPVVPKAPPAPIEEVAPEAKLDGKNAVWIPGYWAWDDEQQDYIWVSGVWRNAPQGRRWVTGSWQPVEGGFRWVSGRWAAVAVQAEEAVVPPPPASLEQGPTSEPLSDNDFWVPGTWQFRQQRYVWRPGFWSPCHENWVWVPDYYASTVNGCYYVPGYWDYGWERRGILFAPCRFRPVAIVRPGFVYRPSVVVDVSGAFFHLWVRPSYGCYFFGDYYDDRYVGTGFCPWYRYHHFNHCAYDPLFIHYRWRCARDRVDLYRSLQRRHDFYRNHRDERPVRDRHDLVARSQQPGRSGRPPRVLTSDASSITRDRIASTLAQRDAVRNELLNPTNEQLRPATLEHPRRQGSEVSDTVRPTGKPRGNRATVQGRPRMVNRPAVTPQDTPSPAGPTAVELPQDQATTTAGATEPSTSAPDEPAGGPSRPTSRPNRPSRGSLAREPNATQAGQPTVVESPGLESAVERPAGAGRRPPRGRTASSLAEGAGGAPSLSPPANMTPDAVNRRGESPPTTRVNPSITAGAETGAPVVRPRTMTARDAAGAASRRSVNRPIIPPSSGRIESGAPAAGSTIVTPRSERLGAPARADLPATSRGRISSSAVPSLDARPSGRVGPPRASGMPSVRSVPRSTPSPRFTPGRTSTPGALQRGGGRAAMGSSAGPSMGSRSGSMSRGAGGGRAGRGGN